MMDDSQDDSSMSELLMQEVLSEITKHVNDLNRNIGSCLAGLRKDIEQGFRTTEKLLKDLSIEVDKASRQAKNAQMNVDVLQLKKQLEKLFPDINWQPDGQTKVRKVNYETVFSPTLAFVPRLRSDLRNRRAELE